MGLGEECRGFMCEAGKYQVIFHISFDIFQLSLPECPTNFSLSSVVLRVRGSNNLHLGNDDKLKFVGHSGNEQLKNVK